VWEYPTAVKPALDTLQAYRDAAARLVNRLYDLNLFSGTGVDAQGAPIYALPNQLTRIEALSLAMRLAGLEETANHYTGPNPFTDVPQWADKMAAYAYYQGITVGVNEEHTLFASERPLTYQEFTVILMRVLGYNEKNGDFTFDQAMSKAVEIGLFTVTETELLNSGSYVRADAVIAMANALGTRVKDSNVKLIDQLVSYGVIRNEAAVAFADAVRDL
jgi:hypothetical protein